MNIEKALNFIGLLNRGGKVLIGAPIYASINKVKLMIIASDCSDNTYKMALDKATSHHIDTLIAPSKEALGHALGFDEIAVIGIIDQKAAKTLKTKWEGE